jgi:WIF domain
VENPGKKAFATAKLFCVINLLVYELYMSVAGIPGELYYVRSGKINEYALTFNIPIKSDVTEVYFDWQSLHKTPHEHQVSNVTWL